MDETASRLFDQLQSSDKEVRYQAYLGLIDIAERKVDWAYEAWDSLVSDLTHQDSHRRAIAAQVLCRLAISDPEGRIEAVLPELLRVTKDERFVTARHCLQSLWRIALAGEKPKEAALAALASRYRECAKEKNGSLIRFDIVESLRNLYDAQPDEALRTLAAELIELEEDPKYRKKYAAVWKS